MKKRFLSLIIILCLVFSQTAVAAQAVTYEVYARGMIHFDMAFDTLDLINAERVSLGRGRLIMDKTLMNTAIQRASELSVVFSHQRPDGRNCFDGFAYAGSCAENIAYGFGTAADVYNAWKNSSGHHKSYIDGTYTRTGLGCVYINGTYYWAQVFDNSSSPSAFAKQSNYKATRAIPVTKAIFESYAPTTLPVINTLTYDSYGHCTLTFNPSKNTTGYRVYRYNTTNKLNQVLTDLDDITQYMYVDYRSRGGWTVQYKLRPYKKTGDITAWGKDSKGKSVLIKPDLPTLTCTGATASTVSLKWTKTNADGFRLLVLNPDTGSKKLVAVTNSSTNTYTVTGLSPATDYTFYVRSFYLPGKTYIYSAYSNPCKVRTSAGTVWQSDAEFFGSLEDDAEEAA